MSSVIRRVQELVLKKDHDESAIFTSAHSFFPRAATIGCLAAKMFSNQDFIDPATSVPIYVRPSEAELMLNKKN